MSANALPPVYEAARCNPLKHNGSFWVRLGPDPLTHGTSPLPPLCLVASCRRLPRHLPCEERSIRAEHGNLFQCNVPTTGSGGPGRGRTRWIAIPVLSQSRSSRSPNPLAVPVLSQSRSTSSHLPTGPTGLTVRPVRLPTRPTLSRPSRPSCPSCPIPVRPVPEHRSYKPVLLRDRRSQKMAAPSKAATSRTQTTLV